MVLIHLVDRGNALDHHVVDPVDVVLHFGAGEGVAQTQLSRSPPLVGHANQVPNQEVLDAPDDLWNNSCVSGFDFKCVFDRSCECLAERNSCSSSVILPSAMAMVFSRHSAASLKGLKMLSLTALRNLLPSLTAASTCGVMLPISSNSTTSNSAYPRACSNNTMNTMTQVIDYLKIKSYT